MALWAAKGAYYVHVECSSQESSVVYVYMYTGCTSQESSVVYVYMYVGCTSQESSVVYVDIYVGCTSQESPVVYVYMYVGCTSQESSVVFMKLTFWTDKCTRSSLGVRLSVRLWHLFHNVTFIASSWNFQESLLLTKVMPMQKKAWCCIGEVPYCFSRSFIKFQGHTGPNIADFCPELGVSEP